MALKTLEAIYCVLGDEPVVQLFVPDGGQWGEIRYRASRLELELFAPQDQSTWVVDAEELLHVIDLAKTKLVELEPRNFDEAGGAVNLANQSLVTQSVGMLIGSPSFVTRSKFPRWTLGGVFRDVTVTMADLTEGVK